MKAAGSIAFWMARRTRASLRTGCSTFIPTHSMPTSGRTATRAPAGADLRYFGSELTETSVKSISPASNASSAVFWSSIGRKWISSKSGRRPFHWGLRARMTTSFGRHSFRTYGPDVAGGLFL